MTKDLGGIQQLDVVGNYSQGLQNRQNFQMNQQTLDLNKAKMDQSQALQNLKIQAANDPKSAAILARLDPEYAKQYQDYQKQKQVYYGSQAKAIASLPIGMRSNAYSNLYNSAKNAGEDVSIFPVPDGDWSDVKQQTLEYLANSSVEAEKQINMQQKQKTDEVDINYKKAQTYKTGLESKKLIKETELLNHGGGEKPPTGYRFTTKGDLEAIPGGPAGKQSADSAGKTALIRQGSLDIDRFRKLITNEDGSYNRAILSTLLAPGAIGSREENSTLFNAVDARLRLESGAAVPPSEVKAMLKTFAPGALDSDKTITSKLNRLKEFFDLAEEEIGRGKGGKIGKENIDQNNNDPLGIR